MATFVVSAIRRELGSDLSITTFFRHPTVKDIAALLDSTQSPSFTSQSRAERVGASATIIANADSPGLPLFMFPESTGFASVYSSALRTISHKVIAFGDEHWGQEADDSTSISSVVSTLIPLVRHHQPHGPYFLSGWSLGGYMALEAAVQLEASGESVGMVIMFDTSVYDGPLGDAQWRTELDPLLSIVDDQSSWLSQFTRANRMISQYGLKEAMFAGRVVLVKAKRGRDPGEVNAPPSDALNGWGRFLPQIEVLEVDSSHRSMFDSVHGPEIGDMVNDLLLNMGRQ